MATSKKTETLEERKVKALERIADSVEVFSDWFDEIDKDEWSNRIQFYLAEFHNKMVLGISPKVDKFKKDAKEK